MHGHKHKSRELYPCNCRVHGSTQRKTNYVCNRNISSMNLMQEVVLYTLLLIIAIVLCIVEGVDYIFVIISKLYITLCSLLIADRNFWKYIIKND